LYLSLVYVGLVKTTEPEPGIVLPTVRSLIAVHMWFMANKMMMIRSIWDCQKYFTICSLSDQSCYTAVAFLNRAVRIV